MYLIHPLFQIIAMILMFYAFYEGSKRFRSKHLKMKLIFNRKLHIKLGKISLLMMTVGLIYGAYITTFLWKSPFVTGIHGYIGIIILPMLIFGLFSGFILTKKSSFRLSLIHGICNSIILVLAIMQIITGITVYQNFF